MASGVRIVVVNMKRKESALGKERKDGLVWVKDSQGNGYVCPASALKKPDDLSDEEKSRCVDASAPRGLVSPL